MVQVLIAPFVPLRFFSSSGMFIFSISTNLGSDKSVQPIVGHMPPPDYQFVVRLRALVGFPLSVLVPSISSVTKNILEWSTVVRIVPAMSETL